MNNGDRPAPSGAIERGVPASVEETIRESGLPPAAMAVLRTVARSRAPLAELESTIDELIDHLHCSLRSGRDLDQALAELGSLEPVRQALEQAPHRPPTVLEPSSRWQSAVNEVGAAFRSMRRAPAFLTANVVTLGLGLAAALTLFALFDAIVLRPLPFEEPEELFELRQITERGHRVFPSYPNFADLRERTDLFEAVISTSWGGPITVLGLDEATQAHGLGISRNYFSTVGVEPILGRPLSEEEHAVGGPPAVMVSEEFWRTQIGAPETLEGASIRLGREVFPVVGVVPSGFRLLDAADLYLSHERFPGTVRGAHAYRVVVRLAEETSMETATAALRPFFEEIHARFPDETESIDGVLLPLHDQVVGGYATTMAVLFGAALLVIVLAGCDVGASMAARAEKRTGEIALSRSLGATRSRLVLRQVAETLLVVVPSYVLALLLSGLTIAWIRSFGADQIPRLAEVSIDPRVIGAGLLLALVCLAAALVVPMRRALRVSSAVLLRSKSGGAAGRRRGWTLLVAAEIAAAFLMFAGAGLLLRSLDQVYDADLGFRAGSVIAGTVQVPRSKYNSPEEVLGFNDRLLERLQQEADLAQVSMINYLPFDWGNWVAPVFTPESNDERVALAGFRLIDPGYFEVLDIPMLAGQTVPDDGRIEGATAVVVNRSLARSLVGDGPLSDAIGRTIRCNMDLEEEWVRVIGVAEEARHWRAQPGQQPEIYIHYRSRPRQIGQQILVFEARGSALAARRSFEAALESVDAEIPVRFTNLSHQLDATTSRERLAAVVLVGFAAITLILTLAGIVGVVARATLERRREAGIRLALGASPRELISLLQSEILKPVAIGLGVGVAAALATARFLDALLYQIEPTDPATLVTAAVLLLGAAFLASYLPARRILLTNLISSIRHE